MAGAEGLDDAWVEVGPRSYLDRFLAEYRLSEEQVRDKIKVRADGSSAYRRAADQRYLVYESLLRSHGQFPCAGDDDALDFCEEIADRMELAYDIPRAEAVARINDAWSAPGESGRSPRIWIVGLDLVYHETADYWAADIYYGHDSFWWLPHADPQPLPPP
jgi:hypothetical protein